jgi:hypothetical protein
MIKLHKNKNPNFKKLSMLFAFQVVTGALPAILFAVYAIYVRQLEELDDYEVWVGILFMSIILLLFAGYIVAARRYNVLVSGFRGERLLVKTAKKLMGDYTVFTNLPIRYRNNRSELDLLIVGENRVLIIEVKNHSGVIIGSESDETWVQRKYYRKGRTTETEMKNPFKQIKRQREILKSILRSQGFDVWIDSILFFSGEPGLRLRVNNDISVASSENELIAQINDYKTKNPPTAEQCAEIVKILREMKSGK